MKNLKTLSILAIFGLFASTNAFAQTSDNANVAVAANVLSPLTVADNGDISLGDINAGEASTLKAGASDGTTTNANVGTTTYGQVTIEGIADASTQVDFTTATLTDTDGANPTTFTTIAYSAGLDGGGGLFTTGQTINLDNSGDATIDFGGTLAAIAANVADSYSTANTNGSAITVTVTYN